MLLFSAASQGECMALYKHLKISKMNNPINNTVFDSRDLLEYRDELSNDLVIKWNELVENDRPDFIVEDINEIIGTDGYEYVDEAEEFHSDFVELPEYEEYEKLQSFIDDLEGAPDFEHGEGIIHENYWEDYCQELVTDCGYISKDFPYWIEINWTATADNISADYMTATFEDDTYYIRA